MWWNIILHTVILNLRGNKMKDKFIVVDCMGIKQVGFDGAMGVSILDTEQIVQMMNGFNNTCERLGKEVQEADTDREYLLNKVVHNIITDWD
jgi:hypothetical protein